MKEKVGNGKLIIIIIIIISITVSGINDHIRPKFSVTRYFTFCMLIRSQTFWFQTRV